MKILILALSLIFTACGTDTGNPGFLPANTSYPITTFMGDNVCTKLHQCYPSLSQGDCWIKLETATNFTTAMGLSSTNYPTLADAIEGVNQGNLKVDSSQLTQCNAAIDALSCSDTDVTSSYSTSTPTNLSNAYHMLSVDSACSQTATP